MDCFFALAFAALLGDTAQPAAGAQQAGKVYRIGYLSAPTRASVELVLQAFLRKLRELGWVEGQNLIIEYRYAEGRDDRFLVFAAELVSMPIMLSGRLDVALYAALLLAQLRAHHAQG